MLDWIEGFRMDHPVMFRGGVALGVAGLLIVGFLALPDAPVFRASGVTAVQKRVAAVRHAVYWSARAALHSTSKVMEPKVLYGNLDGVDADGQLVVSSATGAKWAQHKVAFADVLITDVGGVAQQVAGLRFENARLELYPDNQAVVWIRSVPLNVTLVEAGVARPDPTPPTDIVDSAFATYYWSLVKGKQL